MSSSERVEAYAQAFLGIARAEGFVDEVADELFRFARTFEGSDELRMALTDPLLPADRRSAIVEDLLGGKALVLSRALASFLVSAGRGHDLPAVVDHFVALAAASKRKQVAEVRSAVELDAEQQARLAKALGDATGLDIEVKVVLDPSVLGGIVTTIGDTVIDGSVRHRLEQLKEQI